MFTFRKNGHFYEKIGKKEKPVCIDDEIPFEVPDSWEWVRINTIREVYTGNSINKTEKETKFTGLTEGYNYIATKDVRFDNSLDYDNGVKIPKDLEKFRIAPEGSVLLCIEGGSAGRKIGILNQDVCFGNKLACFKTFKDNNDFLFYYLQSPNFKEIFKSKKTGIIGGVGIAKLRNVLIPIPPLNEQKRIINEINKLNPLINEYGSFKEQLDKLNSEFPDKLKSSILQEAIQGKLIPQDSNDEPASVLFERIRDEKERLIKEKKIKRNKNESFIFKENNHFYEMIGKKGEPICIDDELFNIPDSWEWCTLENILSVHGGKRVPKGYKLLDNPTPYIYIRVTNMKNGSIEKSNLKYLDEHIHEQIKKYTISKDDLYITVAGTIGKVGSVPEFFDGMNLTENANKLTNIFIDKDFLKYILSSSYIQNQLIDKTTKVAQPKLAIKRILSTKIAVPPLNEQKRIVNKLEFIFNELKV